MPLIPFADLPEISRVWVFASDRPLDPTATSVLLGAVDTFLTHWRAHGVPLTVGRDWRDDRFLTIAVDTTQEAASGCSIDGLFRELQRLGPQLHTSFVGGGRVFYRDAANAIQLVDRDAWTALGNAGAVNATTSVFDMSVTTLSDWRTRFETAAGQSWHGALLPT